MSIFVAEQLDPSAHRRLFTVFGVAYVATRWAWLNLVLLLAAGLTLAAVSGDGGTLALVGRGLVMAALLEVALVVHGLGHIASSRLVGAPMRSMILTATVAITDFSDDDAAAPRPRRAHLGRALGGPLLNLAAALFAVVAHAIIGGQPIAVFAAVNGIIGVFTLLPIPSLDGAVLWFGSGG